MLQTLTLFPQFARDGIPLTSTIYSLTDKVTAHAAALLLAPHRRKPYMARNWNREWIPRAIENVRTLWRKRYKDKVPIVHLWVESTKELDEFDLWERDQPTISQIGDEFDSFIDGNPVLLGERETSLSWRLEEVQRRTYPNLSRFAIDILSIPAMSAEPERVFSGCRRTITWQRIWCKGCGGRRVFEIMDKIWRCGRHPLKQVEFEGMRTWRLAMASYLTKT